MHYLTPTEYRKWKKISRQNFWQKVKRGTIPVVEKKVTRIQYMVPIEDTELEGVNIKELTL